MTEFQFSIFVMKENYIEKITVLKCCCKLSFSSACGLLSQAYEVLTSWDFISYALSLTTYVLE